MKTKRTGIWLMLMPIIMLAIFGWLQRNRSDATEVYIRSVDFQPVDFQSSIFTSKTPGIRVLVNVSYRGVKPDWWNPYLGVDCKTAYFVKANGQKIRTGPYFIQPSNYDEATRSFPVTLVFPYSKSYNLNKSARLQSAVDLNDNAETLATARFDVPIPRKFLP